MYEYINMCKNDVCICVCMHVYNKQYKLPDKKNGKQLQYNKDINNSYRNHGKSIINICIYICMYFYMYVWIYIYIYEFNKQYKLPDNKTEMPQ